MPIQHRLSILFIVFLLPVLCNVSVGFSQDIQINEVLASNNELFSDEDGDFEDWIELYNFGSDPINLEGFGLSDNYDDPYKWVLPDYTIEPGEYLLVWASGKDRVGTPDGWTNGIQRLYYGDIPGSQVSDLVNHPSFPDNPTTSNVLHKFFEAPTNIADDYGQHVYTWITPPQTGGYRFWIASDDGSELRLSTDESESNAATIASVPGWTSPREWNKYNVQRSELIFLQAGQRYYLSALMKEAAGGDNLAVRWQWPDGNMDEPLCASHCFIKASNIHSNFRLSASGEEVILTSPSGDRLDEVPPRPIPTNRSYGRSNDGSTWGYFENPTPGRANDATEKAEYADSPAITPNGGVFSNPVLINLEVPEGTDVFYTTDGSMPSRDNGIRYNAPFLFNQSGVLRCIAAADDKLSSEISAASFAIATSDVFNFGSNLPLMVIQDFGTPITPGNRTTAYMSLYEPQNDSTYLKSSADLASRIKINIRGSSSQSFPKKGYGFHILEENESNRKVSLLNMPDEHNWILHGPYSDKSLMRNAVSYELGSDLGHYSPRGQFIELFLHTGNGSLNASHYAGVYLLVERIKIADGRVEIEDLETYHNSEPEITGGYIFKIDRLNPGEEGFRTNRSSDFAYVRPNEFTISKPQADYLKGYIDEFEGVLFSSDFDDPENGYASYIDVPSFIDMHLITELTKEIDGYRLSTFFTKDRNGKIKSGPLWDFNLALGNANYLEGWNPEGWYYENIDERSYMYGWYNRLFADDNFDRKYKIRYRQLRQSVFSYDFLENKVLNYYNLLKEPADRNFQRYDILGEYVWPNWFIADTYKEEIDWMLGWIRERLDWMDEQLGNPLTLIHYWNFNDALQWEDPAFTIRNGNLSIEPGPSTEVTFGTGQDFTGENARFDDEAGAHLRVNNPIGSILDFNVSTHGFKDIIVSFETRRSGSGANRQYVFYSTDGDAYEMLDSIIVTDQPTLYTYDFSDIDEVSNNENFTFRLEIDYVEDGTGGEVGNNRFDNFTVDGEALDGVNLPPTLVNDLPNPLESVALSGDLFLDLDQYFEDPEGDPIEYDFTVRQPDILSASIDGNELQIIPLATGRTTITLSVSDDFNSPIDYDFDVLIYPDPYDLDGNNGAFLFNFWSEDEPEGSFPNHMVFLQTNVTDPNLSSMFLTPYNIPEDDLNDDDINNIGFPYRNTRRTRLNGLNEDGISFINTGRDRDLGVALLALDTRGLSSATLDWEVSTLIANSRVYHMRLQYRTDISQDWKDYTDIDGNIVEYERNPTENIREVISHPLPLELLNQENLQLRWVYYYTGERISSSSGARDMIGLHRIAVNGEIITSADRDHDTFVPLSISPNPASGQDIQFNKPISGNLYDMKGRVLDRYDNASYAPIDTLRAGTYIIRTDDGESVRFVKQ